jgi:hypothetical protein
MEEPTASNSKVQIIWGNLLSASLGQQHFERTCCLRLQGTNTLNKATASIYKVSTLWKYLLSALIKAPAFTLKASPRYKHLGGISKISNNPMFRSRIWKAFNRISRFFNNTEKGNKIIFLMWIANKLPALPNKAQMKLTSHKVY